MSTPENVKAWISNNLGTQLGAKHFRVAALGVLLVTAATLYISMNQGEARSPSANGETALASQAQVYAVPEAPEGSEVPYDALSKYFPGIATPSGKSLRESHSDVLLDILDSLDENEEERVYDELRISFVGIPAPQVKPIDASQPYTPPERFEEDVNERVYDELRMSFVGIPAPRSEATDRLLPVGEDQ